MKRIVLFMFLVLAELSAVSQTKAQHYPDMYKNYRGEEVDALLHRYESTHDTLGIVYTYLLWRNENDFSPEKELKTIKYIYRYQHLVKAHSEENYNHLLLELSNINDNDYGSIKKGLALCDSVLRYAKAKKNQLLTQKALSFQLNLLLLTNQTEVILNTLTQLNSYKYLWANNPSMEVEYNYQSGFVDLLMKRYQKAISSFKRVVELQSQKEYIAINHLSLLFIAQCYRKLGAYKTAENYVLRSIEMSKNINNPHLSRWAYQELAMPSSHQKKYKLASHYWDIHWKIEEEIRERKNKDFNNVGLTLEMLDLELKQVNAQKKLLQKNNQQREIIMNSLWVICGLLFLILNIGIWAYRQRINLAEQQKQMALYEGQEKERATIANELHDNIGGTLLGVKAQLNAPKPNFDLVDRHLEQVYQEIRTLSHTLHTKDIEKIGLTEVCRDFIRLIDKNKIIIFNVYGEEDKLPTAIITIIYRVIQELLSNAVRHAQASQIHLGLFFESQQLIINLEDNGLGFCTMSDKKGLGLSNIRKRITLLGGDIQIESSEIGSSFIIHIPTAKQNI